MNRAEGDASRFEQREAAFRATPGPAETRLYFETIDQVLPGKRKLIVDHTKSARRLFLLEDGAVLGGTPAGPLFAPPAQGARIPEE